MHGACSTFRRRSRSRSSTSAGVPFAVATCPSGCRLWPHWSKRPGWRRTRRASRSRNRIAYAASRPGQYTKRNGSAKSIAPSGMRMTTHPATSDRCRNLQFVAAPAVEIVVVNLCLARLSSRQCLGGTRGTPCHVPEQVGDDIRLRNDGRHAHRSGTRRVFLARKTDHGD
mgnify:CR=1 FL=1